MRTQVVLQLSLMAAVAGFFSPAQATPAEDSPTSAEAASEVPDEGTAEAEESSEGGKPESKEEKSKGGNPAMVGMMSSGNTDAFPLHIQTSLTNQLGQGTFVIGPTHNSSAISTLSIVPRFEWGALTLLLRQTIMLEWTLPDNSTGRRLDWFDTAVDANYTIPLGAGFILSLRGGVRLPLSLISRNQGRLVGLAGRANVVYITPIPGLVAIGGAGFAANVNIPAWRGGGFFGGAGEGGKEFINSQGNTQVPRSCLVRTGELAANACARPGSIGSVSGVGILSYTIGQFNFSGVLSGFTIIRDYFGPDDEFTSVNARPGPGHTPLTNGDLSVNYTPVSWFTLTGGLTSFQPMFDSANKFPRFPFWDFISVPNNFSSVYMTTTFSY